METRKPAEVRPNQPSDLSRRFSLGVRLLSGAFRFSGRVTWGSLLRDVPPGIRVVSVDLFNTLLLREPGAGREIALKWAGTFIRLLGKDSGSTLTEQECLDLRRGTAKALRRQAITDGLDPEFRHEELVSSLAERLAGRPLEPEAAASASATELDLERSALGLNPEILAFAQANQQRGLRIIAISDMYFSGSQLHGLLSSLGVSCVSHVYSSCDLLLTKTTGRLFSHVLKVEGLEPRELLHVGDSLTADVLSPRAMGIRAAYYTPRRTARSRVRSGIA